MGFCPAMVGVSTSLPGVPRQSDRACRVRCVLALAVLNGCAPLARRSLALM